MVSLEDNLGRAVLDNHDFSDDIMLLKSRKDGKNYVFEISNYSKNGFDINVSLKNEDKLEYITSMSVNYKSRGPQAFMPEFDSNLPSMEKLKLTNNILSYAIRTLKKNNFDSFKLLLESDYEKSSDKGKERLLFFNLIENLNSMNWSENRHGQVLTKYL
ncbi:MAG: hypothetical protein ACMXX9_01105 [Candidatus Woesearchaeota archaeon]